MSKLEKALTEYYGSSGTSSAENWTTRQLFVVDDRQDKDFGANRELLSYFCQMYVYVIKNDNLFAEGPRIEELELSLEHVPIWRSVMQWIEDYGADYRDDPTPKITDRK